MDVLLLKTPNIAIKSCINGNIINPLLILIISSKKISSILTSKPSLPLTKKLSRILIKPLNSFHVIVSQILFTNLLKRELILFLSNYQKKVIPMANLLSIFIYMQT